MVAQEKQVWSYGFWGQTIDVILWNNVEYMCSQSPFSDFQGYKSIFGELNVEKYNPEAPVVLDKNYKAKWIIFDNGLYLYDIEVLIGGEKYQDKALLLETLTKSKFMLYSDSQSQAGVFQKKVMLASWFSGFIYLKRQPEPGENYCDCLYQRESFIKLSFKNGRIMNQGIISSITFSIDSCEIAKNPKNYKISLLKGYDYTIVSNCDNLLDEKLALDDYLRVWKGFYRYTEDEILLNNMKFMCSESPLSSFAKFKNIFPNVWPYGEDYNPFQQNFKAKWKIKNNMLYLYDILFYDEILMDDVVFTIPENKKDDNYNKAYTNRFKTVEKLTGKRFEKIDSFEQEIILADWYSGTLYIKRFVDFSKERFADYYYDCEPFDKIVIEKGKIISIDKTNFTIGRKKYEK